MNPPHTRGLAAIALGVLILAASPGVSAGIAAASGSEPAFGGQRFGTWIWLSQRDDQPYNQTVIARKEVRLTDPRRGRIRIAADSWYRLSINGQWVNDGPSRSWPEHFQYDELDVSTYLREGVNEIEVIARYFGVGEFHTVPRQPGLWAQLDVADADGRRSTFSTDSSWRMAPADGWVRNTAKISIQMEPVEIYDARQAQNLKFGPARERFAVDSGPWRDLQARDVALLTRQSVEFKSFGGAKVVRADGLNFTLPAVRLMHPGLIEANRNVAAPCGMASVLETTAGCVIRIELAGMKLAIDGEVWSQPERTLAPGRHLLLAFVSPLTGHAKDKGVRFANPAGFRLVNPLDARDANPWCFIPLPEFNFAATDLVFPYFIQDDPRLSGLMAAYTTATDGWLLAVKSPQDFRSALGARARARPASEMFAEDFYWRFVDRQVVRNAAAQVEAPAAAMADTAAFTTVLPAPDGDVELMYDLGEQNCGYYDFDVIAPAGTILDLCSAEYIAPDGRIQVPLVNRNGMRYIAREGLNRFTSLKLRSGRYVFLTLRDQRGPVRIRHLGLVASAYPVDAVGSFACSDARLDAIWTISTRTLRLCMQDTFIDCPLYEQTHWVGDARNEGLFAFSVFGAADLARRCIRLTAQSLDRYPMVGCQTPSSWDVLLPAWSFLWGLSTWDYYWYTGDEPFLRQIYPAVIRNLQGAERFVNEQGLFSGPFWNFFDWTPIDSEQKTVLHNSLLMVGAIDSALREAAVLNDDRPVAWLQGLRRRLVEGVNRQWDPKRQAYPDSLHADGSPSLSSSQHTSFLSILYDVIEPENRAAAIKNLTDPPATLVRVGSPFAALYFDETLEKLGREDRIVDEIYRDYLPMLEAGATTVWESFPTGTTGSDGFPTRSHCHAWSSAPSYFLNRIVLGIKATAPGGRAFAISPHVLNLAWAHGTVATVRGPLSVAWKQNEANGTLEVTCQSPAGVEVTFADNPSLAGRKILFNGRAVP